MNELQVQIKTVWGVRKIYPICDKAKLFVQLVGQVTLTDRDVEMIKRLGFTFKVVRNEETL